jgi:hypothetical protein
VVCRHDNVDYYIDYCIQKLTITTSEHYLFITNCDFIVIFLYQQGNTTYILYPPSALRYLETYPYIHTAFGQSQSHEGKCRRTSSDDSSDIDSHPK